MHIKRLKPPKYIPLPLVFGVAGLGVREDEVVQRLQLVVSGHESRQIDALCPTSTCPYALEVVHLHDLDWYLLQIESSDVQSTTCPCCANLLLEDLLLGIRALVKVERIRVHHAKVEAIVRRYN